MDDIVYEIHGVVVVYLISHIYLYRIVLTSVFILLFVSPQGFGCIPSIIMLLCAQWVPESPKWLLTQSRNNVKGDTMNSLHNLGGGETGDGSLSNNGAVNPVYQNEMYPQVAALLRRLRAPEHDVDKEIGGILADAKTEAINQVDGAEVTWAEVFAYRKGTIVGVGLMFFQVMYIYRTTLIVLVVVL